MNKYQHEEGRGCLGKTLGILAIVGITMFSIGSAFANPVLTTSYIYYSQGVNR